MAQEERDKGLIYLSAFKAFLNPPQGYQNLKYGQNQMLWDSDNTLSHKPNSDAGLCGRETDEKIKYAN